VPGGAYLNSEGRQEQVLMAAWRLLFAFSAQTCYLHTLRRLVNLLRQAPLREKLISQQPLARFGPAIQPTPVSLKYELEDEDE